MMGGRLDVVCTCIGIIAIPIGLFGLIGIIIMGAVTDLGYFPEEIFYSPFKVTLSVISLTLLVIGIVAINIPLRYQLKYLTIDRYNGDD